MKKSTFILVILLCFSGVSNAQFLKKLGKKAEKAAEKAVERRVEKKATEKTERVLDSTIDRKRKNGRAMPSLSNTEPAASYAFNYRAEMQITSGKEVVEMNYFLPKTGNFLCALIKDKRIKDNFLTVFDIDRQAMFTFMENEGKKIKMAVEFQTDGAANAALNEASNKN